MLKTSSIIKEKVTASGVVKLLSNGILHCDIFADSEVDLTVCEEIYESALALTKGKPHPILFTFKKYVIPDEQSRKFMVECKRISISKADAFVLSSLPQKIVANFYLKINNPPIPTQFFSSENEAIEWLLKFVDKG